MLFSSSWLIQLLLWPRPWDFLDSDAFNLLEICTNDLAIHGVGCKEIKLWKHCKNSELLKSRDHLRFFCSTGLWLMTYFLQPITGLQIIWNWKVVMSLVETSIDVQNSCFLRRPQKLTKSSTSVWHLLHNVKLTVKILSIFVAFLENLNFKSYAGATKEPR